jgi:UPF0755 protein
MTDAKPRKAFRLMLVIMIMAFLLVFISGIAVLTIATTMDKPAGSINPDGIMFSVDKGESGTSIARRLLQEGYIRSEYLFRFMMKAKGLENSLKAGNYLIESDMGTNDILSMMVAGKQVLIRLTIPEGASLQAIARIAEESGIANTVEIIESAHKQELLDDLGIKAKTAEGFLFPDTYLLPKSAGGDALIRLMVETFMKRISENIPESDAVSPAELRNKVILASIIEREYRVPEEAQLMSSVFENRLGIGMALQSCATVVYIITEKQGKAHPSRIFDRDLAIDDPFNTYMYPGLPPDPICNPGLTALIAVFRPANTDFLYFRLVDESSGTHYFSETLDEHIKAAALTVKPKSR